MKDKETAIWMIVVFFCGILLGITLQSLYLLLGGYL